jgi:hypothetical protein
MKRALTEPPAKCLYQDRQSINVEKRIDELVNLQIRDAGLDQDTANQFGYDQSKQEIY